MARLLAELSSYDPRTDRVTLRSGATEYEAEHEHQHRLQRKYRTLGWRAHEAFGCVPYLCRLARLWVEYEAMRMAWREMERLGLPVDRAEGWRHWRTYLWAAVLPWRWALVPFGYGVYRAGRALAAWLGGGS